MHHTLGFHANLLQQLSDAIKAFTDDLDYLGVADRVTGLTFSEFGRRMASNASGGTDHGEAAPMFMFGKPVAGGILGTTPVIPNIPTEYDNVDMQFDFRSIYATVLRDWFCVPEEDVPNILLHDAPYLNLFEQSLACIPVSVHQSNNAAGESLIKCSPNPFTTTLYIDYHSEGGPTSVQILDVSGKVVATPVNGFMSKGDYEIDWPAGNLPAGTYFCRLQNAGRQQTKMVVKNG